MKQIYLTLAIVGGVVPYLFFSHHIMNNGFDLVLFLKDLFANGAAGGFSADLLISSVVFWVFMYKENKTNNKWVPIAVNLSIGLSCALPLYLYLTYDTRD